MSCVDYEVSEHVAVIRLNRPDRLNAMSLEMRDDLTAVPALQRRSRRVGRDPHRHGRASAPAGTEGGEADTPAARGR